MDLKRMKKLRQIFSFFRTWGSSHFGIRGSSLKTAIHALMPVFNNMENAMSTIMNVNKYQTFHNDEYRRRLMGGLEFITGANSARPCKDFECGILKQAGF